VTLDPKPVDPAKEAADAGSGDSMVKAELAFIVGMILGLIMYLMLIINGSMIMRSVMEEKINRIVEVMISTVKPFDLMMGKILGVGGVGITQIIIWAITIPIIASLVTLIFGIDVSPVMDPTMVPGAEAAIAGSSSEIEGILKDIFAINWIKVIPLIVVYYIGGFLLYSSLFAAVGSAVGDDLGESQSLIWPVMIPIILAIYIGISAGQAPDSALAVFASYFPLFSPIVMPIRILFDPPWWEILLSIGILALGVVLFVWLSGRIYRVGILLYGKKASFKELTKWLFVK
jgi:ABC-2 type transport system permease protein